MVDILYVQYGRYLGSRKFVVTKPIELEVASAFARLPLDHESKCIFGQMD